VIVKGGGALETLARASTLMFDKTGTLTSGTPSVTSVETFDNLNPDEILRLAASLDQVSTHVFANAIVVAARERRLEFEFPSEVDEQPGTGIEGTVGEHRVALGQAAWLARGKALAGPAELLRRRVAMDGTAAVFVAVDGEMAGALVMKDPVRTDTPHALHSLRRAGIKNLVLLSGDRADVAQAVGGAVGADRILSEQSPADKVRAVLDEHAAGVTVMIGDGVNDAPALAQADLGLAIGTGTDVAIEASDLTLVSGDLRAAADAIRLSRRTLATIKGNLFWAFAYNVAAIPLAVAGVLNPIVAAVAMAGSSLFVVTNSLRLRRFHSIREST
jgi:Cu+-exporting ATPase